MNQITESLKKYLEESESDFEEVNFNDKTIDEIKSDLILFSDYFLKFFNSFYRTFKNCDDKKIIEYIEKNKQYFSYILVLITEYKNCSSNYVRYENKEYLNRYIQENYIQLNEFINICLEVFE